MFVKRSPGSFLALLLLTAMGTKPAVSQGDALAKAAAKDGTPLPITSTLSGSVSVQAVLLPYKLVRRAFGKEVAGKYAAVSLTIANRDQKQGMILHTVALDYSRWLFSGMTPGAEEAAKIATQDYEQQNNPARVSSDEVRSVRADFQDAQLWTARNWVIHFATAIGTAAGAVSFSTASDLFAPSVAAFNGSVVPAIGMIWPDNSQAQLNLLNDIAFRTNHVIPAKSSDIVVAFFPIDRFLTPTLKKIYMAEPAVFFNPAELIFEKQNSALMKALITNTNLKNFIALENVCRGDGGADKACADISEALAASVIRYQQALAGSAGRDSAALPAFCSGQDLALVNACRNVLLLNQISLNNIRVVIGGIMTVDALTVPAAITAVEFEHQADPASWKAGKTLAGTLTGSFLTGGALSCTVTDPDGGKLDASPLGSVKVDQEKSTDAKLVFEIPVSKEISAGTKIAFVVTRTAQDKSTTASAPFVYTVATLPEISIAAAAPWEPAAQVQGILTGSKLKGVKIQSVTGKDASGTALPPDEFTFKNGDNSDTTLAFTLTIVKSKVASGSTLNFTLTSVQADGSPVVIKYLVH
jgi:hypothetical protein